jgi:hypothetical protein
MATRHPKHRGMTHFMPGAVTISRDDDWKDRRRFNEGVLETGHAVHSMGDEFLDVIIHSVSEMLRTAENQLLWKNFDECFEQIASGIIFGCRTGDWSASLRPPDEDDARKQSRIRLAEIQTV